MIDSTGATEITPTGALTLTGGAASVWKTAAGSLTIQTDEVANTADITLDTDTANGSAGIIIKSDAELDLDGATLDVDTTGNADITALQLVH